jgi:predicted amidohydrolase
MHWVSLLQARAIESLAYVAGVNQSGSSPRNTFFGASRVVSPSGRIEATAGCRPGTVTADISAEEVARVRSKYPFLKERIPVKGRLFG